MVYTRSIYGQLGEPLVSLDPTFSFARAVMEGLQNQDCNDDEDLGLIERVAEGISSNQNVSSDGPRGYDSDSFLASLPATSECSTSTSPMPHIEVVAAQPSSTQNSKKRKNKRKSKENKRRKREEEKEMGIPKSKRTNAIKSLRNKHVQASVPKNTPFELKNYPTSKPGYIGTRTAGDRVYTLQELLSDEYGFELVEWNGSYSRPIVVEDRVIGVLVGQPNGPDWANVHRRSFTKITNAAKKCEFPPKATHHRRGQYATLACGISHGGGQKKPGNLVNSPRNTAVLNSLIKDSDISRIAGFSDGAFRTWAPNLHSHYQSNLDSLLANDSTLKRNWDHSVWASVGLNFGPQTVTRKHTDQANLAFGMCAVTPLGNFNYTKGGHLVLWTLKLVIQFPPGATILLPSAAIPHSNIPIGQFEERCSITQFSAGGLFRWVDYGLQSTSTYMANRDLAEEEKLMESRKIFGLSLFSELKDLK